MVLAFLSRGVRRKPFHGAGRRVPDLTQLFVADGGLLAATHGVRLWQGAFPLALAREIRWRVPVRAKRGAQLLARGRGIALAPKDPEGPAVLPQGGGVVVLLKQRLHVVVAVREEQHGDQRI